MIVLVRHGETEGNASRVIQRSDLPLNARGVAQAERLAARLRGLDVARVLCSDLPRARMTAAAIVGPGIEIEIEETPLLQERNFGALRGTPYDQLGFDPFAPDYEPPGGEGMAAFHERVARAFALIVARTVSGVTVVITHGLVCRAILANHTQGVVLTRYDNTGVSFIDATPPFVARLINCTQHLRD